MLRTERLWLMPWREGHREAFAALHADPEVMVDLGGPMTQAQADDKFERYRAALVEHGVSRWAIEDGEGRFLGYAGVMPRPGTEHPLGPHFEVGWRLARAAWGFGYASEAARAALADAFARLGVDEIVSYTSADNVRSQGVMGRLGLARDAGRDFGAGYERGAWRGLVWVARRSTS